jgi:5'-3' exonuclease
MSKGFNDLGFGTLDENTVLVVDALNLAFRYKHKRQRNFAADYLRTIDSLAGSYGCSKVIMCADKGKSAYRLSIDPEYKGNRDAKYKTQTEEEKEQFLEFLEDFEKALELVGTVHPVLRCQGIEADDLMAVLTQLKKPETKIWIISTDKDMDQLVSDTVSRWTYISAKVKEVTVDTFEEAHGCTPEEYISIKVLQGDSGDNVPGIPGIGPKRAQTLLKGYGSAFDIYDAMPLPGKLKYIQALNDSGDRIMLNYQLMDLEFSKEAVGEYLPQVQELVRVLKI